MTYDVIGDIHGCYDEFVTLTKKLGYAWEDGLPRHPKNRRLVFVGDLTDRGPQSITMMETVATLIKNNLGNYVPGNHCDKLYRYLIGRNVKVAHGLETTVAELEALDKDKYEKVRAQFCELYESAPLYLQLDSGNLVVSHAGIRADYIGRTDKKVKTFVLYGDITGATNADGTPVRRDWAQHYTGDAWIIYGHTPVSQPRNINRTINIDTGCVFGGALTACRYPEIETVSVPSTLPYSAEKFRSFPS